MALDNTFNRFSQGKSWQEKVLEADKIWVQVKALLSAAGAALPPTPRRPDVRLIVDNISGAEVRFKNPGDHSGSKEEVIPAAGASCAVMVMVKGATLDEQYRNAQTLYERYDLGAQGLSANFVEDLRQGRLADLVAEAYGPAPLQGQADKLTDVTWTAEDKTSARITPQKGAHAAYGARPATQETVFLAQFHIFVKGTDSVPELVESSGMNIAVSADWKTGKETTRPIVPSVGRIYYGEHVSKIPEVVVDPDGLVRRVDLRNGQVIVADSAPPARAPSPPQP